MNGLASPTRTMPPGVPPPPTTGSEDGIRLIAATSTDGTLPPNSEAWSVVGESSPTILLADTDVTDLMGSSYLMSVENARQLVSTEPPKPPPTLSEDLPEEEAEGELTDQDSPPLYASSMNTTDSMAAPRVRVLPSEITLHAALVESDELHRLNAVPTPMHGLDLTALNGLSHRTRAVRLADFEHTVLTKPCVALKLRLDEAGGVRTSGEDVVEMEATRDGTAHAIVLWHTLGLAPAYEISTAASSDDATVRQIAYYLWPPKSHDEYDWDRDVASAQASLAFAQQAAAAAAAAVEEVMRCAAEAEESAARALDHQFEAERLVLHKSTTDMGREAIKTAEQKAEAAKRATAVAKAAANNAVLVGTKVSLAQSNTDVEVETTQRVAALRGYASIAEETAAAAEIADEECSRAERWISKANELAAAALRAAESSAPPPLPPPPEPEVPKGDDSQGDVSQGDDSQAESGRPPAPSVTIESDGPPAPSVAVESDGPPAPTAAWAEMPPTPKTPAKVVPLPRTAVRPPPAPSASTGSVGGVAVHEGETLSLLLRWQPRQLHMQLVGMRAHPAMAAAPSEAPSASGTKAAVDEADLERGEAVEEERQILLDDDGNVVLDDEGRFYVIGKERFVTLRKVKLRDDIVMQSTHAGDLERGSILRIVEHRELGDGVMRARVVRDGETTALGWLTSSRGDQSNLEEYDPSRDSFDAADGASGDATSTEALRLRVSRAMWGKQLGQAQVMQAPAIRKKGIADVTWPMSPPTRTLLARTGPEVARVSSQNFNGETSRPLSEYHYPMLNDTQRCDAFAAAIFRAVNHVQPRLTLDIGCGTAVLSMIAARAGAPRVLGVEMTKEVAGLATELVKQHGLSQAVRVLPCHSTQLKLGEGAAPAPAPKDDAMAEEDSPTSSPPPDQLEDDYDDDDDPAWRRKAELLIFEVLGTDPLCEGLLPTLKDARERLLAPGAAVLPCEITLHAALVESDELHRLNAVPTPMHGLDLTALNSLSHRTRAVRLADLEHTVLTKPCVALRLVLDNEKPPPLNGTSSVEMEVTMDTGGTCHAIVCWFTALLDRRQPPGDTGGTRVSTAPGEGGTMRAFSWGQLAHFLPANILLAPGERPMLRTSWAANGVSFKLVQSNPEPVGAVANSAEITRTLLFGMSVLLSTIVLCLRLRTSLADCLRGWWIDRLVRRQGMDLGEEEDRGGEEGARGGEGG